LAKTDSRRTQYNGFSGSGGIYPVVDPLPYVELNLNPSLEIGEDIYASGLIASVYLKPYLNLDANEVVNSDTLYHNFTGIPGSGVDFKLGELSLGPVCRIEDIQLIDARTRGGGLNKNGITNLSDVIKVQPEAQFFWDTGYFDGQAVPANGALVVRVPKTVLTTNGGVFTVDEVRQKVYKHTALGCYVILEFV
jgi:hypothetical protein